MAAYSNPWLIVTEGSDHVDVDEAQLPYISQRILGYGGCGVVDQVKDQYTGRTFARKVLITRIQNKAKILELFDNELKIIRSLGKHHHIIRIHATYTAWDRLGMVLHPVADSGDLEKYLSDISALPNQISLQGSRMRTTLEKAYGCLAGALAFIHENKIRHKDIKPRNILVHRGGVLYTDFGLSFDSHMLNNSNTEGPTAMSRRYAAPEALEGGSRILLLYIRSVVSSSRFMPP